MSEWWGWMGFAAACITIIAGLAFGIAYIRAGFYGKPVVEALQHDVVRLTTQNTEQASQMSHQDSEITHLRELVTNAAKVDSLRSENGNEHQAMTETLHGINNSLKSLTKQQAITGRTLISLARKMDVEVREEDEG